MITAGGSVGGLLGGLLTERMGTAFSASSMLPLLALLQLSMAILVLPLARTSANRPQLPETGDTTSSGIEALRHSSYLRLLLYLVALAAAAEGVLDYVFKLQASRVTDGPGLRRLFAVFYTATSLLTVLLQVSVLRTILIGSVSLGARCCSPVGWSSAPWEFDSTGFPLGRWPALSKQCSVIRFFDRPRSCFTSPSPLWSGEPRNRLSMLEALDWETSQGWIGAARDPSQRRSRSRLSCSGPQLRLPWAPSLSPVECSADISGRSNGASGQGRPVGPEEVAAAMFQAVGAIDLTSLRLNPAVSRPARSWLRLGTGRRRHTLAR
jgi:hypothetical protein